MKELDSYLNDHLAGSVSALELTEHWAHLHKERPLGVFFSQIDTEIRADQNVLRNLMHRIGIEESGVRQAGAWAAEKVGRVRLMIAGGQQGSLGLVLTLEGLIMGIVGKKLLPALFSGGEFGRTERLRLPGTGASCRTTN